MPTLVLASGNRGKLAEFQALFQGLLAPNAWQVCAQSDFDCVPAEETGLTFVENALLKARQASRCSGLPALADDSGLEVDALQGRPGIYSARFAGPDASDADNNRTLLAQLAGVPQAQRSARYQCVLVYLRHAEDPTPLICQAHWSGFILEAPIGDGGFGYDPLFWVPEYACSAAQLPAAEKNRISHRGRAMAQLLSALQTHPIHPTSAVPST